MNRFALNRATLNGATYALVLAFASVVCSASVNATATRQTGALAPSYSSVELVASAQVTQFGGAFVNGVGGLYPQITHTQAATATLQGTAAVSAFTLRQIQASSTVYAGADIVAIAAGVLGQSQPGGSAQVDANATREQAARSSAQGTGEVLLSVTPTVFRMALANAQASASVRAETSIRTTAAPYTLHNAYTDIGSNAQMIAVAVATRPASAVVVASGSLNGVANIQQPGRAMMLNTANCTADAFNQAYPRSFINFGVADITAVATRMVQPVMLTLDGTATVTGAALQNHSSRAALDGSGNVLAQPRVTQFLQAAFVNTCETTSSAVRVPQGLASIQASALVLAEAGRITFGQASAVIATASLTAEADKTIREGVANPQAQADMQATSVAVRMAVGSVAGTSDINAQAQRVLLPNGLFGVGAQISATALRTALGQANAIIVNADFSGAADQTVRLGSANMQATSEAQAQAGMVRFVSAHISGRADMTANAVRTVIVGPHTFSGTAEMYADTVANPESIDPPERTLYVAMRTTEFARPFAESEFRRAA